MGKRKRKAPIPLALLWTRRDQLRFIDAVEKLVSHGNDLAVLLREQQQIISEMRHWPKRTRKKIVDDPAIPSGEPCTDQSTNSTSAEEP